MEDYAEAWQAWKNMRLSTLMFVALIVAIGASMGIIMVIVNHTALRCGTPDGLDCELNDDGVLAGGTAGIDDDRLVLFAGISGFIYAGVAFLAMLLLLLTSRHVNKAREECGLKGEHRADDAEEMRAHTRADLGHQAEADAARASAEGMLLVNIVALGAGLILAVTLEVFLIIDWIRDCEGTCNVYDVTVVTISWALLNGVGAVLMAIAVVLTIVLWLNVKEVCDFEGMTTRDRVKKFGSKVGSGVRGFGSKVGSGFGSMVNRVRGNNAAAYYGKQY